jgi:hypothetical protein
MKKLSFIFFFFFYQLTFAQFFITGPSTISQNWPYVTFSNYCTSGGTAAYNIWTLPSSGGYFNFAYGSGNPQAIAAQTKIKVAPLNNCVSWGDNATWRPFYNIPATISVTNGGMSATKTILMTPDTYGQTVQPLSTITKTGCASDSIIVGTVTASSNNYALQRSGPNEGCRLGHKWYYYDQTTGNWINFLTVNSQPSISSCSQNFSCLPSVTGKTSQLFGYNVIDSTEWFNGIIKLDISQVPSNLTDSLQVYLQVQHKQGVVLSSNTLQLNVLPTPPVTSVSANGPLTFCLGDSVVLTAAGGSSYSWSTGDTAQSITVKNGGNYSVTAVGQLNQCGNGNTVSTQITSFIGVDTSITTSGPLTFFDPDSLTLTAANNLRYLWNTGDTTQSIVVDTVGIFMATVTDSLGCYGNTVSKLTNVVADTRITVSQSTICDGDSSIITAASGQMNYVWNIGAFSQSIVVKDSGGYYVNITSPNGYLGTSSTETISVVPAINTPTINVNTLFQIIMSGSTALITISSYNQDYDYQWGARGGVVDSSGNGFAYVDWGAPDTNAAVWVIISNGYCTDSVGIDVKISGIGLDDNSLNSIILSPNPNSGLFSIQVDQEHIGSSYQILDNLGRLIDKGIIRDLSQDFDLSNKPKGVYRIQVSNDKALKTLNVVIQ